METTLTKFYAGIGVGVTLVGVAFIAAACNIVYTGYAYSGIAAYNLGVALTILGGVIVFRALLRAAERA